MSIPKRLFRVAADRLRREMEEIEIDFEAFRLRERPSDARRELEEFLRDGAASRRPPSPPPDPLAPDYILLGLTPGADRTALQRAWHRCVRETHPDLKVIFISGYTEDAFRERLDSDSEIHFLPKPFSLKQLAGKVKEVISGEAA